MPKNWSSTSSEGSPSKKPATNKNNGSPIPEKRKISQNTVLTIAKLTGFNAFAIDVTKQGVDMQESKYGGSMGRARNFNNPGAWKPNPDQPTLSKFFE